MPCVPSSFLIAAYNSACALLAIRRLLTGQITILYPIASNSAPVKNGVRPNSVMFASSGTPGNRRATSRNIYAVISASGKIASAPASMNSFARATAPSTPSLAAASVRATMYRCRRAGVLERADHVHDVQRLAISGVAVDQQRRPGGARDLAHEEAPLVHGDHAQVGDAHGGGHGGAGEVERVEPRRLRLQPRLPVMRPRHPQNA